MTSSIWRLKKWVAQLLKLLQLVFGRLFSRYLHFSCIFYIKCYQQDIYSWSNQHAPARFASHMVVQIGEDAQLLARLWPTFLSIFTFSCIFYIKCYQQDIISQSNQHASARFASHMAVQIGEDVQILARLWPPFLSIFTFQLYFFK